jgi:hypothetical protein
VAPKHRAILAAANFSFVQLVTQNYAKRKYVFAPAYEGGNIHA